LSNPVDRRQHQRIEVKWPATITINNNIIEGEVNNISAQGLAICCDEALRLGETYTIEIMPPDYEVIQISGKIMWSDICAIDDENKTVGIGICIVKILDKDQKYFKDFVSANII
jgi:hypothetical protein